MRGRFHPLPFCRSVERSCCNVSHPEVENGSTLKRIRRNRSECSEGSLGLGRPELEDLLAVFDVVDVEVVAEYGGLRCAGVIK